METLKISDFIDINMDKTPHKILKPPINIVKLSSLSRLSVCHRLGVDSWEQPWLPSAWEQPLPVQAEKHNKNQCYIRENRIHTSKQQNNCRNGTISYFNTTLGMSLNNIKSNISRLHNTQY